MVQDRLFVAPGVDALQRDGAAIGKVIIQGIALAVSQAQMHLGTLGLTVQLDDRCQLAGGVAGQQFGFEPDVPDMHLGLSVEIH